MEASSASLLVVEGVFFAIPTNLAKPIVATLIARAQQPTSQLRATAPAPAHVTLANLSFTVSRGWLVSHMQRQQPTFSSRDQLVQMHVLTQPLGHKPDLAALIRHLARTFGPLKTLSTHHVTLAGLHGVQGSATFTHMAGRVTVTALQDPAQRRIVVIETVLHAGATTGDQKQASATLDSLQVSAPAHHKLHK